MVRSGQDWGLFSMLVESGQVDPSSLTLSFGSVSASWGLGFHSPEIKGTHWRRKCDQSGVLYLNNATDTPRKVQVSMLLRGRKDASIAISGGVLQAEVAAGPDHVRFARELTLAPGSHPVDLQIEAPAVTSPPQTPRPLHFSIIDFTIHDMGVLKKGGVSGMLPGIAHRDREATVN
jgi:hypothetical protein